LDLRSLEVGVDLVLDAHEVAVPLEIVHTRAQGLVAHGAARVSQRSRGRHLDARRAVLTEEESQVIPAWEGDLGPVWLALV
jgi:hypothetical protein